MPVTPTVLALLWIALLLWPATTYTGPPRTPESRHADTLHHYWRHLRSWQPPRRRHRQRREAFLSIVDALAPALEAGLDGPTALTEAARSCPDQMLATHLATAVTQARTGLPIGVALSTSTTDAHGLDPTELPGLILLARAWTLSERTGAPLAAMSSTVAQITRADLAATRATESAVAEARATIRVLIGLPLAGPLLAPAIGISPTDLYGTPAAAISTLCGLALLVAGWYWMRRLLTRIDQERPR
ncbi:hypothetical protein KEM60_01088 [Austwickia sp. TVS 96-490-7B]|uniref:type II secretion system F family protein n=1 Tax=Austwickia sp. TVS 96-490-7B TaxID=2830843 RepID=UPI001C55FE1D|nr:type II secretion system F family protein [Austwickia sp. TVS 96-490-7B]MBW3084898.1 hypothetical protein [Austwickia sp. TVS 96-490-7B]